MRPIFVLHWNVVLTCALAAYSLLDAPAKDAGRRRNFGPPAKKGAGGGWERRDREGARGRRPPAQDARNQNRNSLRVGTGRRGAVMGNRRGSLKKRDRTAEKEAKAEAALERNTVQIPE